MENGQPKRDLRNVCGFTETYETFVSVLMCLLIVCSKRDTRKLTEYSTYLMISLILLNCSSGKCRLETLYSIWKWRCYKWLKVGCFEYGAEELSCSFTVFSTHCVSRFDSCNKNILCHSQMLFKEIFVVFFKHHMKHMNVLCGKIQCFQC